MRPQKVTVEHVNVYQGGQAIVGAVTARRGCPDLSWKLRAAGSSGSPRKRLLIRGHQNALQKPNKPGNPNPLCCWRRAKPEPSVTQGESDTTG